MPLIVKDPRGKLTSAPRTDAHPAHLERRPRPAAADDRQRRRRTGAATPTTPTSPAALDLAAILADPSAPGRRLRAARHRRDRDRVRRRRVRGRRAPARGRVAHARKPSTRPTRTGPKKGSRRSPKARNPSSTTTAPQAGASSCTTPPASTPARVVDARTAASAPSHDELRQPLPEPPRGRARPRLRRLLLDRAHAAAKAAARRRNCRRKLGRRPHPRAGRPAAARAPGPQPFRAAEEAENGAASVERLDREVAARRRRGAKAIAVSKPARGRSRPARAWPASLRRARASAPRRWPRSSSRRRSPSPRRARARRRAASTGARSRTAR